VARTGVRCVGVLVRAGGERRGRGEGQQMTTSHGERVPCGARRADGDVGASESPASPEGGAMTDPAPQLPAADGSTDPHLWLEEVTGEEALAWVREHNAAAESELDAVADPQDPSGAPLAATLQAEILEILAAK